MYALGYKQIQVSLFIGEVNSRPACITSVLQAAKFIGLMLLPLPPTFCYILYLALDDVVSVRRSLMSAINAEMNNSSRSDV